MGIGLFVGPSLVVSLTNIQKYCNILCEPWSCVFFSHINLQSSVCVLKHISVRDFLESPKDFLRHYIDTLNR